MGMSQYMNEPVTKFRRLSFPFTLIHSVTRCVTLVQYCGEAVRLRGFNSKVQGRLLRSGPETGRHDFAV